MNLESILGDEALRNTLFPVTAQRAYFAHAGVCPLPQAALDALAAFCREAARGAQENAYTSDAINKARAIAAQLIGASHDEISLLGPTSLALNAVAQGVQWQPGDEVIFYPDDYPSNVYPWSALERIGVRPVPLQTAAPGRVTWEAIEPHLSPRTRLAALASCHYLTGYRIDIARIGRGLRERGILFSLDAIQSLGATPVSAAHVDFLSADSHKWLLGPVCGGILYVKAERQAALTPFLLGSWNVHSPGFIAQDEIVFEPGGRRYEPGTLNLPGICGMAASMELLLGLGIENIAARLVALRGHIAAAARARGYRVYPDDEPGVGATPPEAQSSILAIYHPRRDMHEVHARLNAAGVTVSLRMTRQGRALLRFSPHAYNTEGELERAYDLL